MKLKNNQELLNKLTEFCNYKNIDIKLFEIARIGTGYGDKYYKRLNGPKNVKNKNCTYVIKLFIKYNLVIIWNYKNNHSMSYSYKTIKEKLSKGINKADKGYITHTNNQSEIYFEYSENLDNLLNQLTNNI